LSSVRPAKHVHVDMTTMRVTTPSNLQKLCKLDADGTSLLQKTGHSPIGWFILSLTLFSRTQALRMTVLDSVVKCRVFVRFLTDCSLGQRLIGYSRSINSPRVYGRFRFTQSNAN
jgi:hypothetical protein